MESRIEDDGATLALTSPARGPGGIDFDVRTTADIERLRAIAQELLKRTSQLQEALDSRIVIEQAKGILGERLGMSPEESFEVLRGAARRHRIKLRLLAALVVASRETPPEITAQVNGGSRR